MSVLISLNGSPGGFLGVSGVFYVLLGDLRYQEISEAFQELSGYLREVPGDFRGLPRGLRCVLTTKPQGCFRESQRVSGEAPRGSSIKAPEKYF